MCVSGNVCVRFCICFRVGWGREEALSYEGVWCCRRWWELLIMGERWCCRYMSLCAFVTPCVRFGPCFCKSVCVVFELFRGGCDSKSRLVFFHIVTVRHLRGIWVKGVSVSGTSHVKFWSNGVKSGRVRGKVCVCVGKKVGCLIWCVFA